MKGASRNAAVLAVIVLPVLLAVPCTAVADVEILLSNGDVLPGASVERDGGEFVVGLFGGESVRVATRLVDAIRFTDSGLAKPDDRSREDPSPVEIVLVDGRVLTAVSMDRQDDLYVLDLGGGHIVTIPAGLVSDTRAVEGDPAQPLTSRGDDLEGREAEAVQPPGTEDVAAPPRVTEPRPFEYAGSTSLPPSMTEHLGVFREQSTLRRSETWQPTDTYGWANDITHFDSSRWNDNFDGRWGPTSGVEPSEPGPDFNTSSWYRARGQSERWRPQDGWGGSILFPPSSD